MSPNNLRIRQTPQPLATNLKQPTTTLALSTTFTPPPACALPSQINILPPPGFLIWWNEPVPYTSMTVSSCYPSEFLRSYTSIAPTSARALGSSIVPAMSPLVCPENFCTQYVGDNNYIACCPSGYKFATTGAPIATNRPAYGGICFTEIPISQELTAVVYDSTGSAHQEVWAPTTTGAQGWAHPIDGWAASKPVLGCAVKQSTSSSGTQNSVPSSTGSGIVSRASDGSNGNLVTSAKARAKKVSGGAIAGAVLGALVALAVILGVVLLLLRKKKRARKSVDAAGAVHHDEDGSLGDESKGVQVHQKDDDAARVEVNAVPVIPELDAKGHGKDGAYEMGSGRMAELPAGSEVRETR